MVAAVGAIVGIAMTMLAAVAGSDLSFVACAAVSLVLLFAALSSLAAVCVVGAGVCAFIAWANNWERASIIPSVLCVAFLAAATALVTRRRRRRATALGR